MQNRTASEDAVVIKKTVNGVQTKYHYDDAGRVVMADKAGDQMWFFYNPDGTAMSMKYRGLRYYYVKNQQGDVTGITDQNGNVIVNYEYDTWGKLLAITGNGGMALTEGSLADTISKLNPFRYRSYVYDDETGLYYLKSRYYDPQTGRFVNSDGYVSTGNGYLGHNMFVYCGNNPVMYHDPTGHNYKIFNDSAYTIMYIDDPVIYNTYYLDRSKWPKSKIYIYDPYFEMYNLRVGSSSNDYSSESNIAGYGEHKKKGSTNPSNRNKHEDGQTRKNRDNRGEKGDARRTPKSQ